MADKKANQGTTITPEARVSNNIVRVSNEDGTAGNGLKIPLTDFALRDIQTTRNACIALLATGTNTGADITTGQGYVFDNGGAGGTPTGTTFIRIRGVDLPSGVKGFSDEAEAYITALGVWVRCTYNVTSNTAKFDYLLWAGHISQDATDNPTIDSTNYNISGETPTFAYGGVGLYTITFTGGKLISSDAVKHYSNVYDVVSSGFATLEGSDSNNCNINCGRSGALEDGRLVNTYIEIRLVYTL